MSDVAFKLKKALFHAVTRPAAWMMRSINALIAAATRDTPIHDAAAFPWASQLEAMHAAVLEEVAPLAERRREVPLNADFVPSSKYYYEVSDWRQLTFQYAGVWIEEAFDAYPRCLEVFRSIPGLASAGISILAPRQTIAAHTHPYKGLLIFHFAIVVPRDAASCTIRVGKETRFWSTGKVMVIDPTFNHEVHNDTDDVRIILMGEFKRPDMPAVFRIFDYLYLGLLRYSPLGRNTIARMRREVVGFRRQMNPADRLEANQS